MQVLMFLMYCRHRQEIWSWISFTVNLAESICVHGGIDVQKLLFGGTENEIREEVKKIKELWGNTGE